MEGKTMISGQHFPTYTAEPSDIVIDRRYSVTEL